MADWIAEDFNQILKACITLFIIFIMILIITRIFGLMTFAKMTSIDFASTIAVGSVIAAVVLNNQHSILKGALCLFLIVFVQFIVSLLMRKSSFLRKLLTNKPKLLMFDGKILYHNLDKANISKPDLMARIRTANVIDINNIKAVVLEATGDVSVIYNSDDSEMSDLLLEGVEKT
ncbi:DUF421 domain-containing protein [Formosa sediminum]|uniref:DUF421 domain-containing protein n=1 Tax=Formosa sediminum TaxID=2594004 RepID=A0A516GUQ2_9FLAO|nr:YetF domain-containing protein [Formosa sediminum]QDO95225.1 DUF421 domain-containing protein [Formosa sediminum]